jgi:hypothetical protein
VIAVFGIMGIGHPWMLQRLKSDAYVILTWQAPFLAFD